MPLCFIDRSAAIIFFKSRAGHVEYRAKASSGHEEVYVMDTFFNAPCIVVIQKRVGR